MNKNYFQSLSSVRYLMILLNLIIVIFYGFVFLFTTKYIITNQLSRNFLDTIDAHSEYKIINQGECKGQLE